MTVGVPVITVGFDRTEHGYASVRWAVAEADRRGARVRVVTSEHLPVIADLPRDMVPGARRAPPLAEHDDELMSLRQRLLHLYPKLSIEFELVEGPASFWLSQRVPGNVMVVVGPSAHASETGLWMGGTTRAVVRQAKCPVVVVRGTQLTATRIVVGIDGSDASNAAFEWAIQEANLHLVPLKIVHTWLYPYARIGDPNSARRDLMQIDAACLLDESVERAREACFGAVESELLEGSPAFFLPAAVTDGDVLVLGGSGRGSLRSACFGSTVASVLDNTGVTVAVVPAGQ